MKLPQLTLRDLFWLVLVFAIAVGWWRDQDRIRRERAELEVAEREFTQERDAFQAGTASIAHATIVIAEAMLQVRELELEGAVAANPWCGIRK